MKKKTLLIKRKNRQQGISLVVSLIMLLIMTVIGISAMNTSISKLKLTTGIQQQSDASNNTETSLNIGEQDANLAANTQTIVDGNGFFRGANNNLDFLSDTTWNNAFVRTDGEEGSYIIEYLGPRLQQGGSLVNQGTAGDIIYVYRITARVNNNNATRMFQSLFVSANPPLD